MPASKGGPEEGEEATDAVGGAGGAEGVGGGGKAQAEEDMAEVTEVYAEEEERDAETCMYGGGGKDALGEMYRYIYYII